jgi:PAS domain S-box-containing protein
MSQDGIVIGDAKTGKITYVNKSIMQMLDYSNRDFVIGKNVLDFVADFDKQRALQCSLESVKKNQGWKGQFTVLKQNGEQLPIELTATPINDEHGNPIAYIDIVRDISQRMQTQENLKEAQRKLELANEKLLVVGGLVRHDIGNKMSTLNANAYLARKKGNLEQLLDATASAYMQINRILEFSRDYELLGKEEQSFLDVGKVFNEATLIFPEFKLKVINECRGVLVLADSLLKETFYNLLDDTLKYGKKTAQIKLGYLQETSGLKLIYEDDGVGIPETMKPNLFTKGYGQGSGLGLYLVKKTLEVYGWEITETGQEGKNARFEITIPQNHYKIE